VDRLEALLNIFVATLGRHGYRGGRLAQEESLWDSLVLLAQRAPAAELCALARFVRQLLAEVPGCASCVAERRLFAPMLRQLQRHGGGTRDTLCNSAILCLMSEVASTDTLAVLRLHLLRHHRSELHALSAEGVAPAAQLLATNDTPSNGAWEAENVPLQPLQLPRATLDGFGGSCDGGCDPLATLESARLLGSSAIGL